MTSFTVTWNGAYEAIPADNEAIKNGALEIRSFKLAVHERLAVDHSWAGDANDGKHTQSTYRVQSGNPTLDATDGAIFAKAVSGNTEAFYKDSAGNVTQLTSQGGLGPTGSMTAFAGSSAPTGWLLCQGQAISRSTFAALFTVISTTYGVGDGSTTFNVPDMRGRTAAGFDSGNATGRLSANASGGASAAALGNVGGEQSHTLSTAELAAHSHGVSDPGHNHSLNDPGHGHGVTDPTHAHSVSDPGHGHGVNDPTHTHGLSNTTLYAIGGNTVPFGSDFPVTTASLTTVASGTGISIQGAGTGIGIFGSFTGISINGAGTGMSANASGTGISTQNAGSGSTHNNVQPTLVLNWIIKT